MGKANSPPKQAKTEGLLDAKIVKDILYILQYTQKKKKKSSRRIEIIVLSMH
jgi:hypothetical protein